MPNELFGVFFLILINAKSIDHNSTAKRYIDT